MDWLITSSTAPQRGSGFDDAADYLAFERVLAEARERSAGQMRLCCYVIMPNHFHMVLWPKSDTAMSRFMQWLTLTHAQRWHAHRHSAGTGALYGSRFKSFPIREDEHFLKVCRYVERNPLRAGLVKRAQNWPWGSLYKRDLRCTHEPGAAELLDEWPVPRPRNWLARVHEAQSPAELEALRNCLRRERPYGDEAWAKKVAARIGSEQSLRPRGRPRSSKNRAATRRQRANSHERGESLRHIVFSVPDPFFGPFSGPDSSIAWFYAVYDGQFENFERQYISFCVRSRRYPDHLVPIARDPGGNQILLAFGGPSEGKVYFWDHEEEPATPDYSNCHLIADSFQEFIDGLHD